MSQYEKPEVHRPPPPESFEGSDSDFEESSVPRTSTDIRRHDQEILEGEEEVEKLLSEKTEPATAFQRMFQPERSSGNNNRQRQRDERRLRQEVKREDRREKRRQKRGGSQEEERELMYEMEEGHKDSSDSSGNSSEVDRINLGDMRAQKTSPKSPSWRGIAGICAVISVVFVSLVYGAYKASSHNPHSQHLLRTLSNGTSTFAPTTIFISLDGFRADFLHRNITPSLNAFVQDGVSPKYMLPSFPSVTFPNHFTLVTGLYPEAHGIVGNTFWDPTLKEEFYYTDPTRSMQPKWWQAEPLWVTAENQGVHSAIHMWPGSEAHLGGIGPTYLDRYNGKELLSNKVNRILGLLDLAGADEVGATANAPRPQLIAAYVPNVDQHGHLYGPNSTEIRKDINEVDTMLGDLFQGLEERNLTDVVNVIVVSDHGMASTDTSRLIQLDDIIDMSLVEHTDGWPLYGLRTKKEVDLEPLYNKLKEESRVNENFEVYLRDRDMPERYHFSRNERIAPLWMIPKTGWAITTKEEFDVKEGLEKGIDYHPRGLHGYDHEHPLMRAIFVARGPAFPHAPGSEIDVFQNTEVYNIVCDSLGVMPKPNNGTLRLPLKPVGLHSEAPPGDIPDDPPATSVSTPKIAENTTVPWFSASSESAAASLNIAESAPTPEPSGSVEPTAATSGFVGSTPTIESSGSLGLTAASSTTPTSESSGYSDPDAAEPTRPVVHDGGDVDNEYFNHWWDWVKGKLDGAKDWATGLVDKVSKTSEKAGDATG